MSDAFQRPGPGEYAPYYERYVAAVPDGDLLGILGRQLSATSELARAIGEERAAVSPAPGKWSPRDVLLHVADTERVMAYRALRIARGDTTPLPGFEQDDFAREAGAGERTVADLLDELAAVRGATIALLRSLPAGAPERRGTASGHEVTVRALAYIIAGHELHHQRLLRERHPEAAAATTTRS
ncbi:MAG TPA: DinB family protein [Gemmatimonadales bacterium]